MFPSGLCESSTAHSGLILPDAARPGGQPARGWPALILPPLRVQR